MAILWQGFFYLFIAPQNRIDKFIIQSFLVELINNSRFDSYFFKLIARIFMIKPSEAVGTNFESRKIETKQISRSNNNEELSPS